MEKNIKLNKETVVVTIKLHPWKPGASKVRIYETQARELVKEKYPKIQLGRTIKPCVVKNQGSVNEGEWIFEVVQEKKTAKKKISFNKEKEDVNAQSSNRTS